MGAGDIGGIKALIFDFDGLILDTEWPAYQSWREVYEDHGCEFTLEMWSRVLGGQGDEWDHISYLSATTGRSLDGGAIKKARLARKLSLIENEAILPGVLDHLAEAERLHISRAVVSSSGRDWVLHFLDKLGILSRFELILGAEDVSHVKPHPDLYLAALDGLGISPGEAIAFEDSPNGVRSAKAAGICCVAVPNRASRLLPMPETDVLLETLADLPLSSLLSKIKDGSER